MCVKNLLLCKEDVELQNFNIDGTTYAIEGEIHGLKDFIKSEFS